jgi:glycosyltransferase involved in cell wall biosynthesis
MVRLLMPTSKIGICRIVLHFYPETGGSISDVLELSKHLKPYISKHFVVTKKYYGKQYDDKELGKMYGICIYREKAFGCVPKRPFNFEALLFIPFAVRRVLWLGRRYGFDIIQSNCAFTGVAAFIAGKILGKPVVYMAHGTDDAYGKIQGITETIFTKMFKPNHLFVMNDGSHAPRKFKRILGNEIVEVVYHGIDDQVFNPEFRNDRLKEELGIKDHFVVTSTSQLIHARRVDYAILAFCEFLKKSQAKNASMIIIGEGYLRNKLEKIVRELGIEKQVKFLGKIKYSNIRDYLSISDLIIATSTHNNVNRSTLEAMSCGKPVLAFDSGTTSSFFVDMENCLLTRTGDIHELADKILLLYNCSELGKRIGKKARKFVQRQRSWKSRIRTELDVLRNLSEKLSN